MKKKISYTPYIFIIAIMLIVLWGQTRDQALLPVIKEQLNHINPQTNIAPEDNAFVAMAGFNAATPENMVKEGFKTIQKTIKQTEQTPFEYNIKFDIVRGQLPEISELYQLPCDPNFVNNHCLDEIVLNGSSIQQLMHEQKSFIDNYLALQKFSQFAHILPANIDGSIPYQYISGISQLLTANAILEIKSGHTKEGITFLINDIKFYYQMLNSEQKNIDDTVFFTNLLLQHYFVLDRLLHSGTDLKSYLTELEPLLKPLVKQKQSILWTLENERNYHLVIQASLGHFYFYTGNSEIGGCYNNSCSFNRYFSRLFYKFNGTLNATYLDWQPVIDFAKADYPLDSDFLEKLQTLQTIEKNHHTITVARLYERYGFFFLKNYMGEKHKNTIYYEDGYTNVFIKLYILNDAINQLHSTIQKIY